jgi:hypothetical protein
LAPASTCRSNRGVRFSVCEEEAAATSADSSNATRRYSAHAQGDDAPLYEPRGERLGRQYSGSERLADEPLEVDAEAAAYRVDLL